MTRFTDPPEDRTMSTAKIEKMSTREKLLAMERLWDSLRHEKQEPDSLGWHETVLAARKERLNSPEARFLTIEQVRERFRWCSHPGHRI